MAIISIPTSIGGVAIPAGKLKGPLAKLFGKSKGKEILYYPEDLSNNPTRAHFVQFDIYNIVPLSNDEKIKTEVNKDGKTTQKVLGATQAKQGTQADAVIHLYMPDTLNMSYNSDYQDFSLTSALGTAGRIAQTALDVYESAKQSGSFVDAAKNLIKGGAAAQLAGQISDRKAGTSGAADILLKATGKAVNPQLQLLYKGINLRTFQLDFIFTPKSKDEAKEVKKIIDKFVYHSLPKLEGAAKGNEGQFFVMPSVFKIQFKFLGGDGLKDSIMNAIFGSLGVIGTAIAPLLPGNQGKVNDNIYKVGDCVLTDVNVDYAPNGWAAHVDGAPVQTRLTLQFKEMDIMHRDRFDKGDVR